MALSLLNSVCSLATKLTATIPSSPSSSSSPSLLSPTHAAKEDLEKLQRTLRRIQAVLADAERMEILDESVKLWVKELKEVAYAAEDVLEEYEHELRRIQVESRVASAEASRKRKREQEEQQVRDLNSILSELSIPERIRNIRERFDEISKDREALHLREGDGIRMPDVSMNWPQPTSSHVDESGIFGREQDKDEVIEMLLSDESRRFSVIPIVGMGGLGKTTLAQLVYNDQRVRQYFDCTCWVCVSENFDVSRLTKEMIQSISKESCDLTQLNALQDILKEKVKGKKVLLILDDVWNEQQGPWDSFRAPLGSVETIRIIVTTRNDPVAKIMQTVSPYRPACLSNDQCWLLFRHRAFGGRDPKDYPHLEEIGRKIIVKCGRLPLSVKTIGSLLHYEFDEDRWTDILGSDLWELDQAKRDILPALMLSYHRLPAHLKPCFLFSSLFPKDYVFKKNRLIKLWIAQGFILPYGKERLEDIGSRYFDELQRRSLFQSAFDYFVLHDAIHDVARSISDNEYLSIILQSDEELHSLHDIPKVVRHLFVKCNSSMTVDHLKFYDPKALRTLIVEGIIWYDNQTINVNLDSFGCLRAVELRCESCLTSVSNLKHLRHLYVTKWGNVSHFPELPRHLYNLRSLKIEFFEGNQEIFIDTGNLVSLQRLSLCGPVVFPGDVSVENNELGLMKRACYPPSSDLCKYVESDGILPCLQELTITYNEKLSRLPVLPSSLQSLKVNYCTNLTSLSQSLQSLTSLRKLLLLNCHQLQFRQEESLPSKLQDVHISDCSELLLVTGLKNLTSLRKLHLLSCRRLQFGQEESLPSKLEDVHISDCPELLLVTGLKNLTSLRKLHLSNCRRLQFGQEESLSWKLQDVYISDCWELMLVTGLKNLTSLRKLHLSNCHRLQFGQEESLPSKLEYVHISDCSELLLVTGLKNLTSLRTLHLSNCHRLQFGQEESLPWKLQDVHISDCWKLMLVTGLKNMTSLESLVLERCPHLQIRPDEFLPCTPQKVVITDCLRLEEWCKRRQFQFNRRISIMEELTITSTSEITDEYGVDNLSSLKRLYFSTSDESVPPSDEWLPSTLQTLVVRSSETLKSLPICQNLSSLQHLVIKNCRELTSVAGVQNLNSLKQLVITNCPEFQLSPYDYLPSSLHTVEVDGCKSLRSLALQNVSYLEKLIIQNCRDLTSVVGVQNLNSLKELIITNCPELQFGQDESLPSKLQDVHISDCWKLILVTRLKNMTSLKSLVLERCPHLQISPDEFLPCTPQKVVITDCLRLREWCKRHQVQCNQRISIMKELTITSTSEITDDYGVGNLFSLKRLYFNNSDESVPPSDEWLPPTLQTLVVRSSKTLKSLAICQNLSSLQHLIIENCRELTSVAGVQNLNALRQLVITNCPEFQLSPYDYLPSSLHTVEVNGCKSLRSLALQNVSYLEKLIIQNCRDLTSVVGVQNLNSLKELIITNCPELQFGQDESLPSKLQDVHISNCWKLILVTGLMNMTSLKRLELVRCPRLQISPDECLPCTPGHLKITDCPGLSEWCKRHRFQCNQEISQIKELNISSTSKITDYYGVDNLSSLKRLCLNRSQEPYLLSDEWLPPTVQTLEVRLSKNLKSLYLHQNVSSLRQLLIANCIDLTSVVGMQNTSLKELVITYCPKLQLSPIEYLPSSLQSLEVNGCESLRSLPLHLNLSSLAKLHINDCLNLMSIVGIQNLNSLKELVIKDCPELQLSPNEYLPWSLHSLNVSDCKSLRSLPLLHHKMSAFEMLKLSNCSSLTDVCGLSDVPSLRYVIIWDCPEVLLSSEERLRITCPWQFELATGGLRPKQSDTMAPAKKINAAVGNKDQFLQLGLPMDHASNSLMELPLSIDLNAEPQQT